METKHIIYLPYGYNPIDRTAEGYVAINVNHHTFWEMSKIATPCTIRSYDKDDVRYFETYVLPWCSNLNAIREFLESIN